MEQVLIDNILDLQDVIRDIEEEIGYDVGSEFGDINSDINSYVENDWENWTIKDLQEYLEYLREMIQKYKNTK